MKTFFFRRFITILVLALTLTAVTGCSSTADPSLLPKSSMPAGKYSPTQIILSSTTSTRDSGLMDQLLPLFEKKTAYRVKPIYNGSGAAISLGQKGEADVILVHAPDSEAKFMVEGWGINRKLVMYNDFIIVGPPADPAGIRGEASAVTALQKIASAGATFYSRGDNSGTDQIEKKLWAASGIRVKSGPASHPAWYVAGGFGISMGQLLLIVSDKRAYALTDRATYLTYRSKISLDILTQGDPELLNAYHVIQVNPDRFPGTINAEAARDLVEFLTGAVAQAVISQFGIDRFGEPLFWPAAGLTEADLRPNLDR